jgi:hypothetical protein
MGSLHVELIRDGRVEIQISDGPTVPGRFDMKYIVNESEDKLGQMFALLSLMGPGTGVGGPSKSCAQTDRLASKQMAVEQENKILASRPIVDCCPKDFIMDFL